MTEQKGIQTEISTGNDQEQARRGRPRKKRLYTDDYIELYAVWDYPLRLNLCNDDIECKGESLTDIRESIISNQVRDHGNTYDVGVSVQHARDAINQAAARNAYHPIKAFLGGLHWDGVDHIGDLCTFFDETPEHAGTFARWFKHWIVGAVARVYDQYQNPMLVLDGAQDIGKSHFSRWLCPLERYHQEAPIFPDNKDCRLRLWDTWIWEVVELGSTTRRSDLEALKAFLTTTQIRDRKSYGHHDIIKPALPSFIGTLNNDAGFLIDRTGNRRFLICTLEAIDWDYATSIDVNQLWAQAKAIYDLGDGWKLTAEDRKTRDDDNTAYMVDDPVEAMLGDLLEYTANHDDRMPLTQILNALRDRCTVSQRSQTMTIASVLKSWGASKKKATVDGRRQPTYYGVRLQ